MDEADYTGIRVMLDTTIETMHTPLKIDFSTGDVITPREVTFSYKLLFEERTISILAYNLETILAEKMETLLSRGIANTRMRDYYDIFVLEETQSQNINPDVLGKAFANTCAKRGSAAVVSDSNLILSEIESSSDMLALWLNYQRKFDYAADVSWDNVMQTIKNMCERMVQRDESFKTGARGGHMTKQFKDPDGNILNFRSWLKDG